MSLLLDALKKAADDKQKASQHDANEAVSSRPESVEPDPVSEAVEMHEFERHEEVSPASELTLEPAPPESHIDDEAPADKAVADNDLELDVSEELTLDVLEADSIVSEEETQNLSAVETPGTDSSGAGVLDLREDKASESSASKSYTVSDEALSMLIHKTNRDVKYSKRIVLFSMLLLSLIILTSGGVYYYLDMQAEIATLERKHQIAMQSMRSKTNREKTPVQSEIIRNLVSEAPLDDKVEYARQHLSDGKAQPQSKPRAAKVTADKVKNNQAATVSFIKSDTTDPVEEKLDAAWLAYEEGRYGEAKIQYVDALNLEANNRDALLGLGAIAVLEKERVKAREIYISLLQQDPRDPIAISAMSSLQGDGASLEADENYLIDMLQKNPDAPHLNFALGNVYAKQDKWKSAQQSFFTAWQQDIDNADYIFNLAVCLDQMGKPQQAVGFYRDSLSKADNKQVSFSRDDVRKRITELSEL